MGSCTIVSPGIKIIRFEFLDEQDRVVETQTRQVYAKAPTTSATAMLTTYYSFLALLIDDKLDQAVQLGGLDGSRERIQAALASVSATRRREYATRMFDVREIRIHGDYAEVLVTLPDTTNEEEYYTVRFNVDIDGFWRIESL